MRTTRGLQKDMLQGQSHSSSKGASTEARIGSEGGQLNASSQYLSRWKKRFNVSLRAATNNSQKLPIDHAEAVSAFRRTAGTLRLQHDYNDFSIANMDQTMV
ncbi:hypothetical protein HPB47_025323 [Ixodes persulcatus]|uniref:Uncharacterized protein n=1 Tax=Ixodes persulcatus TaxID=34615 RepID=A0AC60Q1V2_IXOPE|nr:hypothetical protein HPB47_025323 [Ixodes persulcatus]